MNTSKIRLPLVILCENSDFAKPILLPILYTPLFTEPVMSSHSSEAFATRLPGDEAEQLNTISERTDQTRAEILRRAVRYYFAHNPDEIPELSPEGSAERPILEMMEEL